MYSEKIIKLVESYLYSYLWIDKKVLEIKRKYLIDDKDINSWIKSKGKICRTTENIALKNIQIECEIETEIKWHYIIKKVLDNYESQEEKEKINCIKYKYFERCSTSKIEIEMSISRPTQSRMKRDIVYCIALFAVKENLINIENLE